MCKAAERVLRKIRSFRLIYLTPRCFRISAAMHYAVMQANADTISMSRSITASALLAEEGPIARSRMLLNLTL